MENSSLYYDSNTFMKNKETVSCFLFRNYLERYSNSMKIEPRAIDNRVGLVKMMYEHCMKKKVNN